MSMRWASGIRAEGRERVETLFRACGGRRTLMVVGAGFDPRAPVAYECVSAAAPKPIDVLRVPLDPLVTDPDTQSLADAGVERLQSAASACGGDVRDQGIAGEGARSTGMVVARAFFDADHVKDYAQVIVDVSALPRSVFFPLIRGILQLHDQGRWEGDLHVIACDNPRLDAIVTGEGAEPAAALPGFADRQPMGEDGTRIWVPVLGEREVARLEALYFDIRAEEICPVLPFPAADPRRADDLIREYRELLFDRIEVEPRNFIYASESNPFDLYRSLTTLNARYAEDLSPLGETRMVLSAHSSKLLSIGVLLAAYEHRLEVRHASPSLYNVSEPDVLPELVESNLLVDLWLTGEPYA